MCQGNGCPTAADNGVLVEVTEKMCMAAVCNGENMVQYPNMKEFSGKRTFFLDKTTKKHYSLLCNMDGMTLRTETFPERNSLVRIIEKLTPESSGLVEK